MRAAGGGKSGRIGLARAVAVVALVALAAGCAQESPDTKSARLAAQRYLSALAKKDLQEIRRRSTCIVTMQSLLGGNVLKVEAGKTLTLGALDSLEAASRAAQAEADSLWLLATEATRDSLSTKRARAGRLHVTYRNAIRAVAISMPDTLQSSSASLDTRTVRVRVRYGGPLVGPKPVDREQILRLIRAPGGNWIAFSLYRPEDDPRPSRV